MMAKNTKFHHAEKVIVNDEVKKPTTMVEEFSPQDLIKNCTDLTKLSDSIFANHAQMYIDPSNLVIDFFAIMPSLNLIPGPQIFPKCRIVVPISMGLGLVNAITQSLKAHEQLFNPQGSISAEKKE